MTATVSVLLEIMAFIICIHQVYNRKVRVDSATIALYLVSVFVFELNNVCGLGFGCRLVAYLLVTVYCMWEHKDSFTGAIFSVFFVTIVIAVMQFCITVTVDLFFDVTESTRALTTGILVLGNVIIVLPKCNMYKYKASVRTWNGFFLFVLVFPLSLIVCMQFQQRVFGRIQLPMFIFAMPMAGILLVLVGKWLHEQNKVCGLKEELQLTRKMQEKYEELIKSVQVRQHEFKNHLAAILAMRHTYKSYDLLLDEQEKYCSGLVQENKYNELLVLGDVVLTGFLYEKLREIEKNDVEVRLAIRGRIKESDIPPRHLVELTGILLDNALQAIQDKECDRMIRFEFAEHAGHFCFKVSNPFPYVAYHEIEEWFQIGRSTKGKGRGLGLCRVRSLCQEDGCNISYRSIEEDSKNWIEFELTTGKADSI